MKDYIHPILKPVIRPYNKNRVELREDFNYKCPEYGIEVRLQKGFIFDGASIPRLFWVTTGTPFEPQHLGPGLVHDALYRKAADYLGRIVTRKEADKVFKYALKMNRINAYQVFKMYQGLRIGGLLAWNKHRKK